MNYKSLISGYAVALAIYKKESCTCFESLSKKGQQELINAYVAKASHEEQRDIKDSIEQKLDINIGFLSAANLLTDEQKADIRAEFESWVEYYINCDLSDAYHSEKHDRNQHVAEYRADWEQAA